MDNLIKEFQLKYPKLCKEMAECTHHFSEDKLNPYHLEGDVFTHTMMVCQNAKNLNHMLRVACLLHDVGKPVCRKSNKETQRVNFFGHEPVSAFMSIDIMRDLGLNEDQIIHNFQLIALHTEVFKLTQDQITKRFVNNRRLIDNLFQVSECDRKGRFYEYPDQGDGKLPRVDFCSREGFDKELIMLIGLPCSGKSTWVEQNTSTDDFIVSRDRIIEYLHPELTYNEAWKVADQNEVNNLLEREISLSKGENRVIIDMTNMTRKMRRKRLNRFIGYKKKAVVCLAGLEELKKRNQEREGKHIDWAVYVKMMKSFYPPMYDEFEEIEWILT